MKPVLYRYRDSESVIKAMEGYTPGEGWTPLYDQAAVDAATAAERERCSDAIMELGAELAKPVEPVEPAAWRTFDGEGGYMFRAYEDNELYKEWWEKRNPHHKGWVEPLYLHPPTPAWCDAPEVAALKAERDEP